MPAGKTRAQVSRLGQDGGQLPRSGPASGRGARAGSDSGRTRGADCCARIVEAARARALSAHRGEERTADAGLPRTAGRGAVFDAVGLDPAARAGVRTCARMPALTIRKAWEFPK